MQTVSISVAENGLIKKIIDNNINAAGEKYETVKVAEFKTLADKINFIKELCLDIGLDLGANYSQHRIIIKEDWGPYFKPNPELIDEKIKKLQEEIQNLERMRQ